MSSSSLNESSASSTGASSRPVSFLSTLLDSMRDGLADSLERTVFSCAVSELTMSDPHLHRRDVGTVGIVITVQTGRFSMAYEDAEREVTVHICDPCYILIANSASHALEAFNREYREKNGKRMDELVPTLVDHRLISTVGVTPSCPHGLLFENAKDNPESPPFSYCLWRINDTYDPKSEDIQGLRMLACHRDLQELKKTALGYRLTEVQKAYIRGFVGVSSKR